MITAVPSTELYVKVLSRINDVQVRGARIRVLLSGLGLIGALSLMFFAYNYTITELAGSGFTNYFSLLFSDADALVLYWKEFGLTLLESLPLFGVSILILSVLFCLSMLRTVAKNIDIAFTHLHLA